MGNAKPFMYVQFLFDRTCSIPEKCVLLHIENVMFFHCRLHEGLENGTHTATLFWGCRERMQKKNLLPWGLGFRLWPT